MPRRQNSKKQLTRVELGIMQILWAEGPASVQVVRLRLRKPQAYTTVQTMLNILHRKGYASRTLVGRAYEYKALEARDAARGNAVRDLVNRMFSGSVEELIINMVQTKQIDGTVLIELGKRVANLTRSTEPLLSCSSINPSSAGGQESHGGQPWVPSENGQ